MSSISRSEGHILLSLIYITNSCKSACVYGIYALSSLWDITYCSVICHVLTRTQHQLRLLRHNFRSSCSYTRYKPGTQEPLCIYSIFFTVCHFYYVCEISEKKKLNVSSLTRASCNNCCCACQFVKCRQQVFLMAHPLLCIRSPPAGAIDFFWRTLYS